MNDLRTHLSRLYSIFFLSLYLLGFSNILHAQNTAHLDNIVDVTQWINVHFAKGKLPPFSFRYNNINSENFITHWKYNCEELSTSTPKAIQKLITYQDPVSGLKIECTVTGFKEFNAVEWVIRLTNTSKTNTPIMDEFKVLNQTYENYELILIDDGSTDIDSLDAFEYTFERDMKRFIDHEGQV